MIRLEDLAEGCRVKGILVNETVTVLNIQWWGTSALELTYKTTSGGIGRELVYREKENSLEILPPGNLWSFDADGYLLRLVFQKPTAYAWSTCLIPAWRFILPW